MIKQVCFNKLKKWYLWLYHHQLQNCNLTVKHRKQRRSYLEVISPGLTGEYEEKISAYYYVCINHEGFYNIYFSINLLMAKPKFCCRQRETGTFF